MEFTTTESTPGVITVYKCFANRHLTATEYALYDVCRSLSHQKNILYFDGRKIAAQFMKMSKSTAYRTAESLQAKGWFRLLKDKQRRHDGTFSPRQYRVLSHEEWIERHPQQCPDPVPNSNSPVPSEGLERDEPVPNSLSPVPNSGQPVPYEGQIVLSNTSKNTVTKLINTKPVPSEGLDAHDDVDAFIRRYAKRDRASVKKARQELAAEAVAVTPTTPVPITGQVKAESRDTYREADFLATAIVNELRQTSPDYKSGWVTALKQLLDNGLPASELRTLVTWAKDRFSKEFRVEGGSGFLTHYEWLYEVYRNENLKKSPTATMEAA
jgi:hypothetical protein